jgi:TonB family protein
MLRPALHLASVCLLAAPPATAQDQGQDVRPPELVTFVPAEYPPELLAEGVEADVVLSIAIDAAGTVTDVRVEESAGEAFDAAAVDAARQFEFEPAVVDGEPVESEILYKYRFFIDEEFKEQIEKQAQTDEPEEPPEEPEEPDEPVAEPTATDVDEDEYVTVVKGEKDDPEQVVSHSLDTEEIVMMPGTGGDLLKSVQNLPGMARAPASTGLLIIRGSAPGDSLIMMDDHPIPIAYHFGALSSVVNSEFIEEIEFIPGNFSVRYGRGTGGIVNVKPKWSVPDAWHLVGDVDVIDASLWTYGPIKDKGYFGASIRRSYIDAVLEAGGNLIRDQFDVGLTVAPVYWDYQVFSMYRPGDKDELRFAAVGDSDAFRFLFTDPGDDPSLNAVGLRNGFHVLQVHWKHTFSPTLTYTASLQTGWIGADGNVGTNVKFEIDSFVISHRQDLVVQLGKWAELDVGIDLQPSVFSAEALAPAAGFQTDGLSGADLAEMDTREAMWDLATFLSLRLEPVEDLVLVPGIRLDYHHTVEDVEWQPRLVVSYSPFEKTTFSAGVGVYTLPPSLPSVMGQWGNPDLVAERAVHYAVGYEQKIDPAWLDVSVTLFYKSLDRLVEGSDDYIERDGELVPERFDNSGRGRAYGMELLLRVQPGHIVYGWLAYTLSKSERFNPDADDWIPFSFDQPHLLTLLVGLDLPRNWNVSLRFRVASGNPDTAVEQVVFDADYDSYIAIYEEVPSLRLPTFHSLDLRVDKRWQWNRFWLSLYLDIWNVYYAKNPEFITYNYDYSESAYVNGLPIIPTIGLKGGF